MAYLGNNLQVAYPSYRTIDDISSQFNGVLKTFALQIGGVAAVPFPINPQQCLISVNGVIQKPDSTGTTGFTLTGTNIVFASAPSAGWAFFGTVLAGADYVNVGASFPSGTAAVPSVTFDQSTGTGLYLVSSNVLGIATSGVQQLTVDSSGNVSITGSVSSAAGTAAVPTFSFTTDSNTGIYSPGANQLSITTDGTERFRVDSAGQLEAVSLGTAAAPTFSFTTDPNTGIYSPGANQLSITTDGTERFRVDSAGQLEAVSLGTAAAPTFSFTTDLNTGIYSPGADQLAISTSGTGRLFVDSSGRLGIGTGSPAVTLDVSATDAIRVATGTTAERPTGAAGMIRYNSTLGQFEGYGAAWGTIGGGAKGGGSDDIFYENGQTVTTNYTITTNKNAMTAGPVTIDSGATVTVPSGSTWVVV